MKEKHHVKIKICGITKASEITDLRELKPDAAGFVLYEKSKRYVTLDQAKALMGQLDAQIKKVAVCVSPDAAQVRNICQAGFDVLQIHGTLLPEAVEASTIPVWRALNLQTQTEQDENRAEHCCQKKEDTKADIEVDPEEKQQITGYVMDAPVYGSGKTFTWEKEGKAGRDLFSPQIQQKLLHHTFILAGGLTCENVAEGMRLFAPDWVDVSSGVEAGTGKSKQLMKAFIREVRTHE